MQSFTLVNGSAIMIRVVAIGLLVVVLGLLFLYAYRAEAPAVRTVPLTQAITDIQADRVDEISIGDGRATLSLVDGEHEQTIGPTNSLLDAVTEHNRTRPGRSINVRYVYGWPSGLPLLTALFNLIPLVVLVALVIGAAYVIARARRGDAFLQLERLANLRDRGALTEEEFQREKQRLLR